MQMWPSVLQTVPLTQSWSPLQTTSGPPPVVPVVVPVVWLPVVPLPPVVVDVELASTDCRFTQTRAGMYEEQSRLVVQLSDPVVPVVVVVVLVPVVDVEVWVPVVPVPVPEDDPVLDGSSPAQPIVQSTNTT